MICYAGIICEQNLMLCYEFDHLLGIWAFRLDFPVPDFLPVGKESNVPSIIHVDEFAFKVWAPLYII